jgi:hypothetical protein
MYLWDERILLSVDTGEVPEEEVKGALTMLRRIMLKYWKNKVHTDFFKWFEEQSWDSEEDKQRVLDAGCTSIKFAMKASWWDWDGGSGIFFWRWPHEFFEEACFGLPPRFIADPPTSKDRQRPYTDPKTEKLERAKIKKVIDRGYIKRVSPDLILSLMHFFSVAKGDVDIHMVYDGSKSGLNAAIWAPWFALPTVTEMARTVLPWYWCANNDYGKMFLNFPLHEDLHKYCGVDFVLNH